MSQYVIRASRRHRLRLVGGSGYILLFDGINDMVSCGSDSSLDDLGGGGKTFTIDTWVLSTDPTVTTRSVVSKGNSGVGGWLFLLPNSHKPTLRVDLTVTDIGLEHSQVIRGDNTWHHLVATYNDTTKKARIAVDGVWSTEATGVGDYVTDAALNLKIGARYDTNWFWERYIAWLRLSNSDRFGAAGGVNFPGSLPSRCTPPLVDANTIETWAFDEGAGVAVKASVTSPANDGAITGCTWEACS